jgi:UPF0716 family protein affecting phage T7 exclusion
MQKIDKVVIKETKIISVWMIILSALMEAVFLVIGKWNYTVLLGNLLSIILSVLNFLFMGITVQKALEKDEKDARQAMRASGMLRTFIIFAVAGVGVLLPWFSTWTVLIPLFFPRLIIAMRPVFDKSLRGSSHTANSDTSDNEEKEEDNDNED